MVSDSLPTVAIIGGGQLGMLLCQAAKRIDIKTIVVVEEAEPPAAAFADEVMVSPWDQPGLAAAIANIADFVTFEFEAVPDALLDELVIEEQNGNVQINPSVEILKLIKSKALQKAWMTENDIPTLPFLVSEHPQAEVDDLVKQVGGVPFVQKAVSGGYDGYGVQIIRNENDLQNIWDTPSIIEKCVENPIELSVVVAANGHGETVAYHPVKMVFVPEKNVLDSMCSPTGLDAAVDQRAVDLASSVIKQLGGAGVFAVELFLLADGELLVNEVSPRVHNSGHHTIEAYGISQFEQHLRAVCGLELKQPEAEVPSTIMQNLLYSDDLEFMLEYPPGHVVSPMDGVYIHWYGKREGREGRKMGHITSVWPDETESRQRVIESLELIKRAGGSAT